ncbi:MAG: COX15/CtaA family protein [Hyphomonadaceae bacterium]|nr:COX15/CtaA family protein [Hyphomonadaceae bacterium]
MNLGLISRTLSGRRAPPDRLAGAWLGLICVCVVAMIVVGGLTRLTDSGLSITEWDLGKGLVPPLTDARWAEEFALYQRTTEYQVQNNGMSLADFQSIYWWEWGHRFLGKAMGLVFAVPFLFFWVTGRLKGRFWPVLALFALGGAQGAVGWWMVTSGLFGRLDVSPIRLAIHLGMAFAILGFGLRLALGALGWPRGASRLGAPGWMVGLLITLLFGQVIVGALLAGNDFGGAYTDWPAIGGELLPRAWTPLALAIHDAWALQFAHRTLGYVLAGLCLALAIAAARRGGGPARGLAIAVGLIGVGQAGLGVLNLVTGSGLPLSALHQAGAILLWLALNGLATAVRWR